MFWHNVQIYIPSQSLRKRLGGGGVGVKYWNLIVMLNKVDIVHQISC